MGSTSVTVWRAFQWHQRNMWFNSVYKLICSNIYLIFGKKTIFQCRTWSHFLCFIFTYCTKFLKLFSSWKRAQMFHHGILCYTFTLVLSCTNKESERLQKLINGSGFWFLCPYRLTSWNTKFLSSQKQDQKKNQLFSLDIS